MTKTENEKVTLRDIMELQKCIYQKIEKVNDRISGLQIKVVAMSAIISLLVSAVGLLLSKHIY